METQEPKSGYIRCAATHAGVEWQFEVLSEAPRVAVVTVLTADGPLHVGLNRQDAVVLEQKLRLFLEEWPEDQVAS